MPGRPRDSRRFFLIFIFVCVCFFPGSSGSCDVGEHQRYNVYLKYCNHYHDHHHEHHHDPKGSN